MRTISNGQIPKEITIIYRNPIEVVRRWEDTVEGIETKESVKEAFISDSSNKKTIATGTKWAQQSHYNYVTKTSTVGTANQITRANDPIKGVRVFTLEIRGQGGRAYKCITPDGFYVDMREDVLLDTMIKCGIKKNGVLNGEFVFARVASQMKLVRVGSDLYAALEDATTRRDLPVIPDKQLKVGGLYQDKRGSRAIFLGYGDYERFSQVPIYSEQRNFYSGRNLIRHDIKNEVITKKMLWFMCSDYRVKDDKPESIKKAWDEMFTVTTETNGWSLLYGLEWKNRGSFKAVKEVIVFDSDEMSIPGVREKSKKLVDEVMLGKLSADTEKVYGKVDLEQLKFKASSYINIATTGEPIEVHRLYR